MSPEDIKTIRHRLGMTVDALAARLGLTGPNARRTVRRWEKPSRTESNDRGPTDPVVLALRYMAQDWVHKDQALPGDSEDFEVWHDDADYLILDCYLRPDGSIDSESHLPIGAGEWSYWRPATAPPPGLTMENYWPADETEGAML